MKQVARTFCTTNNPIEELQRDSFVYTIIMILETFFPFNLVWFQTVFFSAPGIWGKRRRGVGVFVDRGKILLENTKLLFKKKVKFKLESIKKCVYTWYTVVIREKKTAVYEDITGRKKNVQFIVIDIR